MLKRLGLLLIVGVFLSACQKAQQREKILNGRAGIGGTVLGRLGSQNEIMAGECLNMAAIIPALKAAQEISVSPYDFQIFKNKADVSADLESEGNLKIKAKALLDQSSRSSSGRRRITIVNAVRSAATDRSKTVHYLNSLFRSSGGNGDPTLSQSNDCDSVAVTRGGVVTNWEILQAEASSRTTSISIKHDDVIIKLQKIDNANFTIELTEKAQVQACGETSQIIKKTSHRLKVPGSPQFKIKRGLLELITQISDEEVPSAVENPDAEENSTIQDLQVSPIGQGRDADFTVNCGS